MMSDESLRESLRLLLPSEGPEFLASLSNGARGHLNARFGVFAHDHQLPPEDKDWATWLILGGRGAGKTRAGAEWVRAQALATPDLAQRRAHRIALVGETIGQVRSVMIEGLSGPRLNRPAMTPPRPALGTRPAACASWSRHGKGHRAYPRRSKAGSPTRKPQPKQPKPGLPRSCAMRYPTRTRRGARIG
jgi:hypothetical protein